MSKNITINSYTEKSIVVRGDSKEFKEQLLGLGGKYNSLLNDGNGGKLPGWIFPNNKKQSLEELKSNIEKGEVKPVDVGVSVAKYEKKEITIEMYLALVSRVERLEAELTLIKKSGKNEVKKEIVLDISDCEEDSEEEPEPPKRLLANKKK